MPVAINSMVLYTSDMKLSEWCRIQGDGVLSALSRRTGVSYTKIWRAARKGEPVTHHDVALRLSLATAGIDGTPMVSVEELVYPDTGGVPPDYPVGLV